MTRSKSASLIFMVDIKIGAFLGVIVCEAGCILENLDNYLSERGLIVPLDLGSKGSCQIGGNVATNAGGMRLLRYGSMHANVLGLEVVKANGEILDCLSTLKKDNTGYHLKHLFIGSEGTLRISRLNENVGLQDFDKVLNTFKKAKQDIGEILSAVEVLDNPTMKFINERNHQQSPIGSYPFYLMIEVAGTDESHDNEKLQSSAFFRKFIHLVLRVIPLYYIQGDSEFSEVPSKGATVP
ncbi:hypothetical protein NQ317_005523 [Molorchus minor]|uniref:D-2-hydroxyglutarate dehydrogenase, mitochondrial n=1 Tax=Molorchus minor TaxID=1323400 RepID=A0ABQ9J1Y9_9CUCU|nr:hypothetical protein NQ317_005523 [Molorchus minor]